jgi:acyl dehydratase
MIDANMAIGSQLQSVTTTFSVDMFASGGIKTIHNDQEAAEREGLSAPIAVGPQVAALIFRMMRESLGEGWISGGRCALTFRRPTPVDQTAVAHGILKSKTPEGSDRFRLEFDVWVQLPNGEKTIVGNASGLISR